MYIFKSELFKNKLLEKFKFRGIMSLSKIDVLIGI